jgi:hypothetical protein
MWQAGNCLVGDYVQTENLIEKSAVPIPYETGNGDEGPGNVPNHATGWGEIDVLAAVEEAQTFCNVGDDMLTLSGTIKDGGGHGYPLYAKISLVSDHHNPKSFTDPFSGAYEIKVYKNTVYDLEITSEIDGYQSVSETQLIFDEKNAARDYLLKVTQDCDAPGYSPSGQNNTLGAEGCSVQPGGILAGFIQDAETGLPLNGAAISYEGYFVETRRTIEDPDLADGFYWAFLPMAAEQEVLPIQVSNDFYKTLEIEVPMSRDIIMEKDFTLRHYKEILKEFFSMVWEKIVAFASKIWDHVKEFFQGVWEKVSDFFQVVWENIASFFTNLWGQIGNWILGVFSPK